MHSIVARRPAIGLGGRPGLSSLQAMRECAREGMGVYARFNGARKNGRKEGRARGINIYLGTLLAFGN